MENVEKLIKENGTIIRVKGRMDSGNVSAIEEAIGEVKEPVVIDLDELEYTSSAGLRLILKIKKAHPDTKVINARSEVYEVFEMTGFTEMMEIHKAYRKVSVEGCQVIGKGANGIVYRLDPDTVVKVYLNDDSLDVIQHEREVAKLAFVLGIPTAMSYDVVKVDNHYASMFEMIDAKSFATLLGEPDVDIDKLAKEYASLVKLIHSTHVPDHQLPS
jgi:anti-anti-sigma factor